MPEKVKNKEQIFDDEFYFLRDFLNHKSTPIRLKEIILSCMEKHAEASLKKFIDNYFRFSAMSPEHSRIWMERIATAVITEADNLDNI